MSYKKLIFLSWQIIFISFCQLVFAQESGKYHLNFKSRLIVPEENVNSIAVSGTDFSDAMYNGFQYLVIQFYDLPDQVIRERMKINQVELLDYFSGNAYAARIPLGFNWELIRDWNIRSVFVLGAEAKMAPELSTRQIPEWAVPKSGWVDVVVMPYEWMENAAIIANFTKEGAVLISEKKLFRSYEFRIPQQSLERIAALPWLQWIEPITPPIVDDNVPGKTLHRSNVLENSSRNLTGSNVKIGIWDGGTVGPHFDFTGRLVLAEPYSSTDHGTHVAGTMAGAGLLDPYAKGMAPNALIYSYDYNGSVNTEVASAIVLYNITMTQNSWGYGDGFVNCTNKDPYNSNSREQDINVYNNPALIHCHSSGNSQSVCSGGWGTTTGKAAKNILVVANVTNTEAISGSSSFGPVQDGRIKPEISGMGTNVYSTTPNNTYTGNYSGTSMATPGVSGTIAQLVERYRQLNGGSNPPASLMKAVACNTAKDLGNAGPDYKFGFGRISGVQAVRAIEQNRYMVDSVANGASKNVLITVPANTKRIKVMICWTDPPATANANPALINDLDLTVTDPTPIPYNPWILNPASPSSVATRGVDRVNNIEQVTIDNPVAGSYTLNVSGFSVPVGANQVYALTWEIEKSFIEIGYPNGGEVFVPGTSERIYWESLGITTSQTLAYSTNNGSSWTTISSSVAASTTNYNWTVPSVASSQVLVRVINGAIGDTSDAVFSILGTPGSLAINNACSSSELIISWAAVTNATHYDVLKLDTVSGVWNVLAANVTGTSYTAGGLTIGERIWVSVRARNNTSGIIGNRAIAVSGTAAAVINIPAFVTPSGPTVFCSGDSVLLNATGGVAEGYAQTTIPYQAYSITTDIPVTLSDDAVSAALPIGFTFNFFGQDYTQFYIGSNGLIAFTNTSVGASFNSTLYPQAIPNSSNPNNLIALFWTDLNPATGGTITYFTTGTLPNRKLIVYYNNLNRYGSTTNKASGRIELYEGSNIIEMYIDNLSAGTNTMGLENAAGSLASFMTGRNRTSYSVAVPEAVRFQRSLSNLLWQPGLQTTPSITATAAGNYSFSYTVNGCTYYSDTVTVSHLPANVCPGPVALQVKAYPEGFYLGNGKLRAIVSAALCDTVQVSLAAAVSPHAELYSANGLLDTAGNVSVNFPVGVWGSYWYIVLKHRNALETWSADSILLNLASINYNFTTAASQAYGSNQRNLGAGVFGIYSGDINQDGFINDADQTLLENASAAMISGYLPADLTGDNVIESADYSLLENNNALGIFRMRP